MSSLVVYEDPDVYELKQRIKDLMEQHEAEVTRLKQELYCYQRTAYILARKLHHNRDPNAVVMDALAKYYSNVAMRAIADG